MAAKVKRISRLSRKNQLTIPVDVLRETGIAAGDQLRVEAGGEPGEIRVRRAESWADEIIAKYAGSMPGVWPPAAAAKLRREWERLP